MIYGPALSPLWASAGTGTNGKRGTDLSREAGHGGRDPVLCADAPGAVVGRAGCGARGTAAGRVCEGETRQDPVSRQVGGWGGGPLPASLQSPGNPSRRECAAVPSLAVLAFWLPTGPPSLPARHSTHLIPPLNVQRPETPEREALQPSLIFSQTQARRHGSPGAPQEGPPVLVEKGSYTCPLCTKPSRSSCIISRVQGNES